MQLFRVTSIALAIALVSSQAAAQHDVQAESSSARPQYQSLRYEEDWSALRDSQLRTDVWDRMKYLPLKADGWYLSLGGESRLRYETLRNAAFGSGPQDANGYVLQRHLVHADLHGGRHIRFFSELQSGLETGRTGGPRPTDEDRLELHQAFGELRVGGWPRSFTLRVGRQEVAFGSGRLISASEGRNVRRTFDAIRPIVHVGRWTWNAMVAKLVAIEPGVFNNGHEPRQTFGGFGFIRTDGVRPDEGMSGYYLRLRREVAPFNQGEVREVRHTLGSRTWGRWAAADYNYELIFQWGSFGDASIRAWALATETGSELGSFTWPMRIALRADLTTGDRRPDDPTLQTFNPLFPGTAYSGRAGLVGPANSIDVTPTVRLTPATRLTLTIDHGWYWRQSFHDGLYGIDVNLVRSAGESRGRAVGRQLTLQADARADRHLAFGVTLTAFFPGRFVRETRAGADVLYAAVTTTYRF
jgi:hypothetical protein